jgi:MFS family permease
LQIILLIFTSLSVCCFESIIYVYAAELYPTEIRSIGFGWVSLVGIMGSIVAPFAKTIAASVSLNSWFVPAALGLVAWMFSCCLPETYGKPLQDSIEERSAYQMEEKKKVEKEDNDSTTSGR